MLTDDNPNIQTATYTFKITVTPLPPPVVKVVKEIVIPKISKLRAVIKSISSSGKVVVSFSHNLIIPANISQIDEKVLKVQIKPGKDSLPKDVEISKWNVTGKKYYNHLKIGFTGKTMEIKLTFVNPLKISHSFVSIFI